MAAIEAEETLLTIAEAAEYTNRSTGWLNKPENKAILADRGVEFGGRGRGQGAKIPKTLLDELGWVTEKRERKARTVSSVSTSGDVDVEAKEVEIASLDERAEALAEELATVKAEAKRKRAELRTLIRAAEKAELAKQRDLEKTEGRVRSELEKAGLPPAAIEATLAQLREAVAGGQEAPKAKASSKSKTASKPKAAPKAKAEEQVAEAPAEVNA